MMVNMSGMYKMVGYIKDASSVNCISKENHKKLRIMKFLFAKHVVPAIVISKETNIEMKEVLKHLEVLNDMGFIDKYEIGKGKNKITYYYLTKDGVVYYMKFR